MPTADKPDLFANGMTHRIDEAPVQDVLAVLIGHLVGLTVELVRRQGHDVSKPIKIDGGTSRDITIHKPKSAEAAGGGRG